MTNREIRGVAGQLCLVLLSLLPMYVCAMQDRNDAPEEQYEQQLESSRDERA
ncbi:hypothetical protein [Phaeodactylibacter xiamenensis]|uniref:hypothetical protein n=1 Tax=Phaeodactylibacter xiamenensis TaxID=1524460 RepID=UPI0024A7D848|nr:hypothetical protein [Phaeodactylibacter xiamenensis]